LRALEPFHWRMPHARLLPSISFNFTPTHSSTSERTEFHGVVTSKATHGQAGVRSFKTVTLTRGGATRIGRCLTTPSELQAPSNDLAGAKSPQKGPPRRDCPPSNDGKIGTADALTLQLRVTPKPDLPIDSERSVKNARVGNRPDTSERQSHWRIR